LLTKKEEKGLTHFSSTKDQMNFIHQVSLLLQRIQLIPTSRRKRPKTCESLYYFQSGLLPWSIMYSKWLYTLQFADFSISVSPRDDSDKQPHQNNETDNTACCKYLEKYIMSIDPIRHAVYFFFCNEFLYGWLEIAISCTKSGCSWNIIMAPFHNSNRLPVLPIIVSVCADVTMDTALSLNVPLAETSIIKKIISATAKISAFRQLYKKTVAVPATNSAIQTPRDWDKIIPTKVSAAITSRKYFSSYLQKYHFW